MGLDSAYTMTIGGQPAAGEGALEVINPATGQVFAHCPKASAADLDRAVAAATQAFPAWKKLPLAERQAYLKKASTAIMEHADELAALFTREQGRPLATAKEEIMASSGWLRAFSRQALPVEITEDTPERRVEVHHEALGVVCAIVPWNFPVLLASWKIAPALLAGNTMVLKPSPFTPLCMLRIAELLREVLPPGVFNVICGDDSLGPLMTRHPGFAKIAFTGSTATGKKVMESAAHSLKRLTLELGGNDAAIVLPDVDVNAVAQQIFFGAFYNTAQVCIATKRLYIHDDIYDALRDRLHAIARKVKVGDGAEAGSVLGPVQNAPQFKRVRALIDEARSLGYKLLEGAPVPEGGGYFIPVTLVDNPPEDARVVTEEAFGPILPLLRFSSIDEVIERANNTPYGLAGAVWSSDIDLAVSIAHRLETGTVWINQNLQSTPVTPLAGHKQSGIGVENGLAGLLEYTQPKSIFIPKPATAKA